MMELVCVFTLSPSSSLLKSFFGSFDRKNIFLKILSHIILRYNISNSSNTSYFFTALSYRCILSRIVFHSEVSSLLDRGRLFELFLTKVFSTVHFLLRNNPYSKLSIPSWTLFSQILSHTKAISCERCSLRHYLIYGYSHQFCDIHLVTRENFSLEHFSYWINFSQLNFFSLSIPQRPNLTERCHYAF